MTAHVQQFPENKWTIQDKLNQLRSVIKLQDRASKQSEIRALAKCKKQAKHIRTFDKENDDYRETLDTNIRGNDLRRRTTMRNNRNYQLAYHRLPTTNIVENISQVLFNKVKDLDKLRYERREMEKTLMALKLQLLELKGAKKFVLKTWKEQEVSNKVQNMIVKQNAANTVKETYEKMIKILKDDAQNYDKILASLKADKLIQSKCILKATAMGQRATEELSNLREEYKVEEKNILTVMKTMDMTAKSIKADLEKVTINCRTAVRTESVTRFGSIPVDDDEAEDDETVMENLMVKDLTELEDSLKKLKSVTEVLTFNEIYPRIEQQVCQKVRLLRQLQLKESLRDRLLDERNKLEALLESLEHTMVSTTTWYRDEKKNLISEAKWLDKEIRKTDEAREKTGALLLCIRMGLLSLSRKLDRIDTASKYDLLSTALEDTSPEGVLSTLPLPETNVLTILANVNRKMEMLILQIKSVDFTLTHEMYLRNKRAFEFKIINKNVVDFKEDEYELAMTEMLEELGATDDPLVPTRIDIKNRSARIVEIFGTEHIEPDPKTKRRSNPKKK